MKVSIINKSKHTLPEYQTNGSAGMDLKADIERDIILLPHERKLINTNLFLELQPNYEAQIRSRSGLAFKYGIAVLNSPGTIDSDYRGEINVLLINHSNKNFTIHDGDRIAQLIISKYEKVSWNEVSQIQKTLRGEGGFCSTGI